MPNETPWITTCSHGWSFANEDPCPACRPEVPEGPLPWDTVILEGKTGRLVAGDQWDGMIQVSPGGVAVCLTPNPPPDHPVNLLLRGGDLTVALGVGYPLARIILKRLVADRYAVGPLLVGIVMEANGWHTIRAPFIFCSQPQGGGGRTEDNLAELVAFARELSVRRSSPVDADIATWVEATVNAYLAGLTPA